MAKLNKIMQMLKNGVLAVFLGFVLSGLSPVTTHADFCADISSEFSGFLECDEQFSSFSKFQGGIQAPTGEGLDASLTQTDNVEDFVLRIANFALGFLGMIALL